MNVLLRHASLMCLLSVTCLIVCTEVQAESERDAQKRSFAELLARRTKADAARESAAAARKSKSALQSRATDALKGSTASTSPLFSRVSQLNSSAVGVNPATLVVPSGFGAGRDAYTEELYVLMLGRDITQPELDYWSKTLASGVNPFTVAESIWYSSEHRILVQEGQAPGIPLRLSYFTSLAYGKAHQ